MPQVTMEDTTLRYGAMAVGALAEARELETSSPAMMNQQCRHYSNAVYYYCEALRLQSRAQPTREGLRTALLSSLLFICFEAQRGNVAAALKHMTHGFSMLNELAACTELASSLVSIAQAPPSLVQDILECYKPLELQSRSFVRSYNKVFFSSNSSSEQHAAQSRSNAASPDGESVASLGTRRERHTNHSPSIAARTPFSSLVSTVQTVATSPEIISSPRSADSSSISFPQPLPASGRHRCVSIAPFNKHSPYFRPRLSNITSVEDMPSSFSNFDDAQGYWSLIQKAMVSHIPMLATFASRLNLTRTTADIELDAKLTSVKRDHKIEKFINEAKSWLSRWARAWRPLQRDICRNAAFNIRQYLRACNLQIEYLILHVYTCIPRFSSYDTAKSLTPQYRQINRLAETLLKSRPNYGFAMDAGWTWPLFVSSFCCRDSSVREDAIRILGSHVMRNALRDSRAFRAIALRNQEVEQQILCEGTEEEQWLRLRRREIVFEDPGASIIYRSPQKDCSTGLWELVEEVADHTVLSDGTLNWRRRPVSDAASILLGVC